MTVSVAGAVVLAGVITLAVIDHGSSAGYNTTAQRWVLPRLGASGKVSLASLHGRPVVVNFFASWCAACAAELDAFATVAKQHASKVVFLGVDTNDADHHAAISLLAHAGARYPVVVDTSSLTMTTAYGIANLPVTFFLDARHRVVREVLGAQSAAQLRANVARLLAAP